jgi:hypothetical protein
VLVVPPTIVAECLDDAGTPVSFTVTAMGGEGFEDFEVVLTCSAASGDLFPHGTTTVFCSAYYADVPVDLFPSTLVHAQFEIDVVDTTPPVLTVPGDMVIDGCQATVVSYTSTATDLCDGQPTLVCTPEPGSAFPVGTTTVTCTATDDAGNVTTQSFLVTVVCAPAKGGGGHTPGFWQNKNGRALIDDADLAALRALSLVESDGTAFDPTAASHVKSWINGGSAKNMALKLSQHLAAMKLNVLNGFVNAGALVTCDTSVASGGTITIQSLMEKADAELALHPLTPSGNAHRAYQEDLKDALDAANNNENFVD